MLSSKSYNWYRQWRNWEQSKWNCELGPLPGGTRCSVWRRGGPLRVSQVPSASLVAAQVCILPAPQVKRFCLGTTL